ncbi:MAG: hypothetical protein IJD91_00500 [Clostridia bacterium]|nr:hypothetical protein [Clostridia bacterium]
MKMWLRIVSAVLVLAVAITAILLFKQEEKECCLCSSFRYHAPCLIDLETGKLIELDLYFPHETLVAELADPQPEMGGTFSFVCIGNVSGTKLTDSKVIELSVPLADKTSNPALCKGCRRLLPSGYSGRYILADLYDKEIKELIPIVANTSIDLRCYEITMVENTEKNEINVTIQGTLDINSKD